MGRQPAAGLLNCPSETSRLADRIIDSLKMVQTNGSQVADGLPESIETRLFINGEV